MKQKYTKKCETGVQLRPASIEEAGLFSDLDEKQDEVLGTCRPHPHGLRF